MTTEQVKETLQSRIIPNLQEKFYSELYAAYTQPATTLTSTSQFVEKHNASAIALSKKAAELGLLLLNRFPDYIEETTYGLFGYQSINQYGKRYYRIEELLGKEAWNSPENYDLLVYFFGTVKAAYARHAWNRIPFQPYQKGYSRRSFRSPNNQQLYLQNQLTFLISVLLQVHVTDYTAYPKTKETYYDLSVAEQMRYAHALGNQGISGIQAMELFHLWAAALDMGDAIAMQQARDILFNNDPVGKVTRELIKALMTCDKQEAWAMVEQLLLAAQRQEGLRQTILEALDETSTGALQYIIRTVLNHKLERFSSVIRALDTWVGLGWEGAKENTARRFLEKALLYLEQPDAIPQGISSMDNTDVYMALWALGVTDVETTIPFLEQLGQRQQAEKRGLAVLFAGQTGHYKIMMPVFQQALNDHDLRVSGLAAQLILFTLQAVDANYYAENYPNLYTKLKQLYDQAGTKEQIFEGFMFSWMRSAFNKKDALRSMILLVGTDEVKLKELLGYVEEMDADIRRSISRAILPKQTDYSFKINEESGLPLTAFQRQYAMLMLKDRTEYDVAYKALYHEPFTTDETGVFADLLKRKSAGFREKIVRLLLRQQDEALLPVLEQVVSQGDGEQRLAGLDILIQLQQQKRMQGATGPLIERFSHRKNISQKEQILLEQLTVTGTAEEASAANGFGLYNPADIAPVQLPAIDPESDYEQRLAKQAHAFSLPVDTIKEAIADLYQLFDDNRNYEFEAEGWDGSKTKVLLGNHVQPLTRKPADKTKRGIYETWPLHEVWEAWGQKWKLDASDLLLLSILSSNDLVYGSQKVVLPLPAIGSLLPPGQAETVYFYNSPFRIVTALAQLYHTEQQDEFCLDACTRLFASFDEKILQFVEKGRFNQPDTGWQSIRGLSIFLGNIHLRSLSDSLVPKLWALYHWRQFSGLPALASEYPPPFVLFCRAYQLQIIGDNDLYRGITTTENLHTLSAKKSGPQNQDLLTTFPFLVPMFNRVQNRILDVEVKRGDTATPVTALANSLQVIYGVHRLAQLLAGLGKTSLSKAYTGHYYGSNAQSKQDSFSSLIKKCYPLETDTQAGFKEEMRRINAGEKRLLEVAMYAPQWQSLVSNYLGWKGLDTAIWWMHAHTKTDAYQARSAEAESEIAKYSDVEIKDFGEGAVDKEWFVKAYKLIGKDRWPLVYDTAKYISDGNGHRRARIYADVLLGNTSLTAVTEKIKSKRDQDYVRIYGLVPFSKKNTDQDILSRYEYLEGFRKESKQFGSLKQSSEAGAIRVALENLARNAGYPDPIRLTWAMESKQVQSILSKETQVQYDDVLIGLVIGEDGLADVVAFKADKQLKDIPAKYRKDKKVLELAGYKKTLREQYRRSRKALEDAMVRGDQFRLAEVTALHEHPVIFRHLEKLLFVVDTTDGTPGTCGFFTNGTIGMPGQPATTLNPKDMLRIAHPTDFYRSGNWAAYQHHLFSFTMQQPFKQVFRELYLPTADELAEQSISRRYAGHQVQPQKTLALLKTRGWKVDNETGLQKVFHQQNFVAKIYAMADWFSPADIESPTLETVEFIDLKTYKNVAFSTIEPRIFSEVMRDIDLVVSVAHVGGVDPEASHSSIEMRAALLRETLRLFKVTNVTIAGSHAAIKGTMGEYSVHLGSAVAHQVTKGYLSILPVHSQHRGRLFLPFVDDDPRSAEVVSKVLLLANDNEIKDPTILGQLR